MIGLTDLAILGIGLIIGLLLGYRALRNAQKDLNQGGLQESENLEGVVVEEEVIVIETLPFTTTSEDKENSEEHPALTHIMETLKREDFQNKQKENL